MTSYPQKKDLEDRLSVAVQNHNRCHDRGLCYGDSHAIHEREVERLQRLLRTLEGNTR